MEVILRRFEMLSEDPPDIFFEWAASKGLDRNDLLYILTSIKIRSFPSSSDTEVREEYRQVLRQNGYPL